MTLGQTFDFQIFSEHEECVQVLLGNIDFSMVDEVDNGLEISQLDTAEVDKRMMVWQTTENVPEEGAAGGQDDLMHLDLLSIVTRKSQVKEVVIVSQITKCNA